MPLTLVSLLRNLVTDKLGDGTNYFAVAYGNRVRPWSAGYRARARAEAANTLYGVNHPGESSPRVIRLQGAGAANNASPFTYTIPAAAIAALTAIGASLPINTALTTNLFLNAHLFIYANKDQANKQMVKRFVTTATPTDQFPAAVDALTPSWEITAANTIKLAIGGVTSGALYKDLPLGWVAELILPDMSTVQTLKTFSAAGEDMVSITDFIGVAGGTSAAQTVALNRIFR